LRLGQGCETLVALKISIIIPAFNEERLLGETLRQVRLATGSLVERGWDFEVIVCDNNSTDRTAEIARSAGARVVFEPVNQIARARNCGAAAATGDWLLFIDADSHPSPALMSDVADAIQSGRYLAGGSIIRLEGGHRIANWVTQLWNFASRCGRLLAGSFIFCDAAVFRELGGFSNELFAGEELELTKRLQQHGEKAGRGIVILKRHPLLTSARKMQLYSMSELFRFFLRAAVSKSKTLRDRNACYAWYDGRR